MNIICNVRLKIPSHLLGNTRSGRKKWLSNRHWFELFITANTIHLPKFGPIDFNLLSHNKQSKKNFKGADPSHDNAQGPVEEIYYAVNHRPVS